MQQVLNPSPQLTFRNPEIQPPLNPSGAQGALQRADSISELPSSSGFAALLAAFRATGGTARGDDVARLLEDHGIGDFIGLARLIAGGEVFGFEWRKTMWIPMFQFELRDLSVKPEAQRVLKALGDGFEGWTCAAWFARPNSWLNLRAPVDLVATHLEEVLEAARADRFIALG
jgi:hypothetical protein